MDCADHVNDGGDGRAGGGGESTARPSPLPPAMQLPRDKEGLPILAPIPEGVRILAVATDACARELFGRPYVELSAARGEVCCEVAKAVCDAVAAYQIPEHN